MIKGTRRYNSAINVKLSEELKKGELINGQSLGIVSGMRYGLFPMSFNGCEVIAVYNALTFLGKSVPLCDVISFMEKFRVLWGLFGCNAYNIGKALEHFGVDYRKSFRYSNSDVFIISFWTGRKFLSSVHTVFCIRTEGYIKVYNRYNACPCTREYRDTGEFSPHGKTIVLYEIKGG